jgi:hypothetical protein
MVAAVEFAKTPQEGPHVDLRRRTSGDSRVRQCHRRGTVGRVAGTLSLALLPVLGAGCSIRNDPSANRFRPRDEDLRLMSRASQYERMAGQALDNLDERLENILY